MNRDRSVRVHLLHVRKTGGTAVKHALAPCAGTDRCRIELHPHGTRLRDVPPGESVVFFVRDPIDRFVSGFFSKQRQGRPRYDNPWTPDEQAAFERFASPNALAVALSSADEAVNAAAVRAMKTIRHVKSSYWDWFEDPAYFRSRVPDIFFIGFVETLDADFARLRDKLGLPAGVTLPEGDVEAHRNPRDLDRSLVAEARRNLEAWYARDYAFLELCRSLAEPINARI